LVLATNLSRRFGRWHRARALIRHEYRVFHRNADDAALALYALEIELEILPTLL
jgi:3-methyladenine DNA glycosylase AlkC